jgi:hypothetical protein
MRWKGLSRKARTFSVPSVPSMTDADQPPQSSRLAHDSDQSPPIDRAVVQYLDRVRAIYRPARSDTLEPGLERFVGREDFLRHVGPGSDGTQPLMECPVHWPSGVKWVPLRDLEILEILDDRDVRAG